MERLKLVVDEHITDLTPSPSEDSRSAGGRDGIRRFRGLFSQSASAISDQGFFALGNFAMSTILARQMTQAAFGQFSSAFAAFILLVTGYCAFAVDPMWVFVM